MYPHERSLVKQLAGKPFALIGVNSDDDLEVARKAIKDKDLNWRSFWNGPNGLGGPISAEWGVRGWPTLYVLDAKGVIRFKPRAGDAKGLDNAIQELLAEMDEVVEITHEDH